MKRLSDSEEWAEISQNLSEAAVRADNLGRDDIMDILDKAIDFMEADEKQKENMEKYRDFALRMKYRYLDKVKEKCNRVTKSTLSYKGREFAEYSIHNYDLPMFLWAHNNGFGNTISNNLITVPGPKLSEAGRRSFEKRAELI